MGQPDVITYVPRLVIQSQGHSEWVDIRGHDYDVIRYHHLAYAAFEEIKVRGWPSGNLRMIRRQWTKSEEEVA